MEKRLIVWALYLIVLGLSLPAIAQKIPRVGILRAGAPLPEGAPDPFLQELRLLGYIHGKNIFIDIRYAHGNRERLAELVTELVQSKVDAIYTLSPPASFAPFKTLSNCAAARRTMSDSSGP